MTSIIIVLLIILLKVPFINLLGDKGIGYYSTAFIIYLLITTCISYGLPKVLSEHILKYRSKGQYKHIYKIIQIAFIVSIMTGLTGVLILYFGADFIAERILNAKFSALAIRGFSPAILFSSLLGVVHGVNIGLRKNSISKISCFLERIITSLFCIISILIYVKINAIYDPAAGAFYASVGYSAGILILAIFLFISYMKYKKKIKIYADKCLENITDSTGYMIKSLFISLIPVVTILLIFYLSNFIDYTVFNQIMSIQGYKENNYIILLGMLNGKYLFFISLPLIIIQSLANSRQKEFKKVIKEGNNKKFNSKMNQHIHYTMLFILPCTATFILYSRPLMNLLFTGINDTPSVLLRVGAISIVFYSLAIISNSIITMVDHWTTLVKNALLSLLIQVISLLIMMIIFQWNIISVVLSRIIFAASLCVLNEHTLRDKTGYVLEKKRSFSVPVLASFIMSVITFIIFLILNAFLEDKFAILLILPFIIIIYIMSLAVLGGISQREMYQLPGGKFLAPLCRKLHLFH